MATGAGKTFTAITAVYRLLKHTGVNRVLFLVDTKGLGEQSEYSREQAIIDGVNVGEDVFMIETQVGKQGGTILNMIVERKSKQVSTEKSGLFVLCRFFPVKTLTEISICAKFKLRKQKRMRTEHSHPDRRLGNGKD